MANPYTKPTLSGYNSNPPADDGSEVAANEVLWSTIKTKLPDPLNTYISAVNDNVFTAFGTVFGNDVTAKTTTYTVQTTDRGKFISCTNTFTLTLPAAGTAGNGFVVGVINSGTGVITVDGDGSETINGSTTVLLYENEGLFITSDGSNWFGYHVLPNTLIAGTVVDVSSGSPTAADWTSVPAWVQKITIACDEVGGSGSDNLLVQIGDSGGLETTGYKSDSASGTTSITPVTTGFAIQMGSGREFTGAMTLYNITGNVWVESHVGSRELSSAVTAAYGGGRKELSATLDRVRITWTGSDTFSNGQVNILYE